MKAITLEQLLEAGCHFGHQVNRKNPQASEFIYDSRAGVDIIDLEKTLAGLNSASEYLKKLASKGGKVIFVGTKRQARNILREQALKARREGAENLYFVTYRWIGGTLTNFSEVSKNFKRLDELNEILNDPNTEYTKRELATFARERDKLVNFYEGIHTLTDLPDALVIIDTKHEDTAVTEAKMMDVDTVGVVDTNSDPSMVLHSVPSNDDAVGAVKLLVTHLIDAWSEGEQEYVKAAKIQSEKAEKAKKEDEKKDLKK